MRRVCTVESISAVRCCARVFTFVIVRNMGLQGYSNIYMLILLLSAIALIVAQTTPGGNNISTESDGSAESGNKSGDDNKSDGSSESGNKSGDDNKSDTSTSGEDDDDDDKNNTTVNPDNDDNGKNDIDANTGGNNDKNNTSANSDNDDNGKNNTNSEIENDIRIITACIMHTRVIGKLVLNINHLTRLIFIVVPGLRDPFRNFYDNIYLFTLNLLLEIQQMLNSVLHHYAPFVSIYP